MLRFFENKFDREEYKNVRNLDEVLKMTYTFIDYEKDKSAKEGKLSAFYDLIKKGIITIEQAASSIGISNEQLIDEFKKCNLVL